MAVAFSFILTFTVILKCDVVWKKNCFRSKPVERKKQSISEGRPFVPENSYLISAFHCTSTG